jgi:hypothetical protein
VDRETHNRYLEYRDRYAYFGATTPILTREQFVTADADQRTLEAKGAARDDEEEARFQELSKLLFRD